MRQTNLIRRATSSTRSCKRFTEGFGTADLRHAQTVLDQLA
jgi:hypothetical protein